MEKQIDTTDFSIIDTYKQRDGNNTIEIKDYENKLIIKQFTGVNSENFLIKRPLTGKRLHFSFFRMNGIYYVNINGEHIVDYKCFIHIQKISNEGDNLIIQNSTFGIIKLLNCDIEVFQKSLQIMNDWIKPKQSLWNNLLYYIFN